MKYFLPAIVLFGLAAGRALAADALLVDKKGKSTVGYKVRREAGTVFYVLAGGEERSVPLKELYQILPKVQRGRKYPAAKINQVIKVVRRTQRKFPKLKKQTNALLDEWLALQKQVKTLTPKAKAQIEADIQRIFAGYEKSARDPKAFADLNAKVGMIKYRDIQALFHDRIEAKLKELKTDFFTRNFARLERLAANSKPTIKDFEATAALATDLLVHKPEPALKEQIGTLREKARQNCLAWQLGRAKKIFATQQTVAGYLKVNALFDNLEKQVAAKEQLGAIAQARRAIQAALEGYDFTVKDLEGFPITRLDKEILSKTAGHIALSKHADANPAALIFPAQLPAVMSLKRRYKLPVRIVFRRQPPDRLGLFLQPANLIFCYKDVKVKNGHAKLTLAFDLSKVPRQELKQLDERLSAGGKRKLMWVCLAKWWEDKTGNIQNHRISNRLILEVE